MIMTSSPQQTSFLNTNGTQNITPFTANTNNNNKNNQLSTIQQIQVQQAQQQQQLIQQMARNQQQQQQQIQQYLANQRTQQMMNQHQIPPHPQHFNVNPMNIMNPMNSINTMQQAMISPSTPSISSALSMPSPNVITNVSTTPRQSYPSHHIYGHNAHTHGHTHNQYHHTHGHGHGHSNDGVSPQHRPQTPITSIQSTGAPSVTSITSFTSMPSIGPNTIMGITAAASFHGHGHGHHNNDNTQAPNNLFNQQQNTFNNNGNNNNNNNNQQQNNNNNSNNNNNDDDKQGGDSSASNGPSAVLGQPPNSVIVNVSSNNKYGLRNYLVRARRILRLAKKCRICGIGSAVSVACEVTEVLKREKVAKVLHLSTGLIDDEQSTRPTIEIVVQRGKFAHLVSDFRRRKVIEVFEKKDCNIGGALPFDFVRKLDLAAKFKADCYRTHQAKRYLQCLQQDPEVSAVNLPKFIHYCSIIIHPLLLEYHFKMAISELGGYVDVHDGHLPREHTEEKVQQLQKLGRIQPFLASGDDIEFDPSDFRHWFNMNHMNNRNMNMAVNKQQQQQQQQENNVYIINQQQQQLQQLQQQQENEKNKIPNYPNPMNINNINNINNTNNNSNMNELQANNNYDSMNSMNINNENNGSLCLVDDSINNDNTTTNAIDGGSMTRIMSNDQPQHSPPHVVPLQVEAIIKKHEEDYTDNVRVIPEDESITQDIDDESEQHNKEIQHKIDNVIEEDDGSEPVKATSEVSKATTILSINNDD